MTQREEEGTTNPHLPPYDGVTSWSDSTHLLVDVTAIKSFENTASAIHQFSRTADTTKAPSACQDSVSDMGYMLPPKIAK